MHFKYLLLLVQDMKVVKGDVVEHFEVNEFLKFHPNFRYHYTYFSEITVYEEIEENDN